MTGFLLVGWEFLINIQAHLNQAIFYSVIGQFDMAKHTLDTRWFLLYIGVYVFAMWDCYRITIDLNKFYLIADRLDASMTPFKLGALEINYLDNRNLWNGASWSLMAPGLGHLYLNRLPSGFLLLSGFVAVAYYSRLLPAIHATSIGDFHQATEVLNPQWFLFLPSLAGFSVHDCYLQTIASNRLFKMEQSIFLVNHYQSKAFRLPFGSQRR